MAKIEWGAFRQKISETGINFNPQAHFSNLTSFPYTIRDHNIELPISYELPYNSENWKVLCLYIDQYINRLLIALDLPPGIFSLEIHQMDGESYAQIKERSNNTYAVIINAFVLLTLAEACCPGEGSATFERERRKMNHSLGMCILMLLYCFAHELFHLRQSRVTKKIYENTEFAGLFLNVSACLQEFSQLLGINILQKWANDMYIRAESAYCFDPGEKAATAFAVRMLLELKNLLVIKESEGVLMNFEKQMLGLIDMLHAQEVEYLRSRR